MPSDNAPPRLHPESLLVAAGRPHAPGAPLNTPIVPASNFADARGPRAYARDDATPTWEALETLVAGLEGGDTVAFASGMAAIAAVFEQLPVRARVVIPEDCYQAVTALAERGRELRQWHVRQLPGDDTQAWIEACGDADLIWLETPSNPLLVVADLARIAATPRVRPGAMLAVDNTFATALRQRPLALGADLSVQSVTKYVGGHSDLLAGTVSTRRADLYAGIRRSRLLWGATPGALEVFLAVRGARTLALRLERAERNALALARRLEQHAAVTDVRYPGLASHPQHELARTQLGGFGSIVTFEVAGGAAAADRVCAGVRLVTHATSLGAVESTLERRSAVAGQEHLPAGLLRLSVGIEQVEDLWRDLRQALGG